MVKRFLQGGNRISVFGRRGVRRFNLEEMRRLYIRNGKIYTVSDEPPGRVDDYNFAVDVPDAVTSAKLNFSRIKKL